VVCDILIDIVLNFDITTISNFDSALADFDIIKMAIIIDKSTCAMDYTITLEMKDFFFTSF